MTWQAYPKYKDSGVEWLGEIPEHWEARRLKTVSRFAYGDSLAADNRLPGDYDVFGSNGVVGQHNVANTQGPCLIVGRKGSFGKVVYSERPCFAIDTTYFVDASQTNNHLRWLFYCLQWLRLDSYSKDSAVPGLAREDAYGNLVPYCRPDEQRAIAAFLDRETERIDALIARKERQIELLQEKRAALISHTVTKGLDPNVPMKDSGVEWLGEIPAHWKPVRLKYLIAALLQYGANEPAELDDPDLPRYVRITDINEDGTLREDIFKSLPEDIAEPYLLEQGDLLFARSGATVGKTFLYQESWGRAAYAGYLIRARIRRKKMYPKFAAYFCRSTNYWNWLSSVFIQATIQNVSAEKYAGLVIAVPPTDEQSKIITFLDEQTGQIDSIVSKVIDSITKLHEYRAALISAAVTGKIDVREEQVQRTS